MDKRELDERKEYLALQAFYLEVKGSVEKLEKKHPEFVYNGSFRKKKGVNDFEENDKNHNDISL